MNFYKCKVQSTSLKDFAKRAIDIINIYSMAERIIYVIW